MGEIIIDDSLRERLHVFRDRYHAGKLLADMLKKHISLEDSVLLAIPAGGIPVGYEISRRLNLPMDLVIVRKLQIPWDPEAGFGAISSDGEIVLNERLVDYLGLSEDVIEEVVRKTLRIIRDRFKKFRMFKPMLDIRDKTVILVDDGLASGYTMLAAIRSIKKKSPKRIIVAVPTASTAAVEFVSREVDKILCLNVRSSRIFAVADAYRKWRDLADDEVVEILRKIG
ncbi:MAG TPA: phosphoribosyltransferase [Nitrososphaeria archaeon]|nr:MAG: phosphoribosyltransferase [Candidatus Bathyarchaeota archaeon]HDJ66533.1 phosphoribosyltransferase [Nitrososphaeria archaeon]